MIIIDFNIMLTTALSKLTYNKKNAAKRSAKPKILTNIKLF